MPRASGIQAAQNCEILEQWTPRIQYSQGCWSMAYRAPELVSMVLRVSSELLGPEGAKDK